MRFLPEDIRAEALLDYLPEGSCQVSLRGLHKRNACCDVVEMGSYQNGREVLALARKSLYDSLPEYMFHPYGRFDQMTGRENREKFTEEYDKQEKEKEAALAFFAPVDLGLLSLSREVYRKTLPFVTGNSVLQGIIGDRLTEDQLRNRFIRKALAFLPEVSYIRGNRTLLTLLLRKLFKEERMDLVPLDEERLMEDLAPRYVDSVGGEVGELFAGNAYPAPVCCYQVYFWSDEVCDDHFGEFIDDVEEFRQFIRDWFLSVDEDLAFRIEDGASSTWLSDSLTYSYLNHNTNL